MSHPPAPFCPSEYLVRGQVIIDATAVIAPGVILQAAPDCHLTIGAGACIGRGSIIQAWGGNLCLGPGVILGARCLVMGQGEIGQEACLGAEVTVWNTSVAEKALIAPHSLLGDLSPTGLVPTSPSMAETTAIPSPWDSEPDSPDVGQASLESIISETVVLEPPPLESPTPPLSESEAPPPPQPTEKPPVVGQVYINQLLVTLFPERDLFRKNS